VLHPAGYDRHRSRSEIIAGLRKPSTKTSSAKLQGIGAVRQHLDDHLALTKKDPPGDRFLYGYEDTYWLLCVSLVYDASSLGWSGLRPQRPKENELMTGISARKSATPR
jgi:hypothetical protein